jgi:hypothetical protein
MKIYKGARLHDGQKRIIKNLIAGNEKINCINAARQSGKSFMLQQLLLYFSLNEKCDILVVSPINSQNLKIYDSVFNALFKSGVIIHSNRTEKTLRMINNSVIYFKSAENYDNIRSGTYKYVFCDEFAFFKKDAWVDAINPTMAAKKGSRAFLFSTPRGKNNFWEYCVLGQNTEELNYSYNYMSYLENPHMDLEFVEECKKRYPPAKFDQEFMGAFIDSATVFDGFESCATINNFEKPIAGKKYYAGIDLANKVDRTVVTIIDENGRVVYIYSVHHSSWKVIVEKILKILTEYNDPDTLVEINSIGDVIFEMLSDKYNNLFPIFTANNNKQIYIEDLIKEFSDKTISIPIRKCCEYLHEELDTFEMNYSPKSRKIIYSARVGFHDDHVISLALANKSRKDNKYVNEDNGYGVYDL